MRTYVEKAYFAGGCFWCTEAVFKGFRGILSVTPGYSGGSVKNPAYEQVSAGNTGHAETIEIEFDPTAISFETLLTVFFATHDPTTLNRQGNDVGTQYRSVIFFTTDAQKKAAEDFINKLNSQSADGRQIVTEVRAFEEFFEAEDYHKNYFARNPGNQYCEIVINPKLEKVQQKFAELLKSADTHSK